VKSHWSDSAGWAGSAPRSLLLIMSSSQVPLIKTNKFAVYQFPHLHVPLAIYNENNRDIQRERDLFQRLYDAHPTSDASYQSLQERKNGGNHLTQKSSKGSLTYGEVIDMTLLHEVIDILQGESLLNASNTQYFYDLGSGTGKMVIAAALTRLFNRCRGVEIMQSLHNIASEVAVDYRNTIQSSDSSYPDVEFFHGDILDLRAHDWTCAGVIYINSTCFDDELMNTLVQMIRTKCASGTVVVTLSIPIPEKLGFTFIREIRQEMSW
jgi:SAM-dependent methyltransferase